MASTPTNTELHVKPLFATRARSVITSLLIVAIVLAPWLDVSPFTIGHPVVAPTAGFILWALALQRQEYRKLGIRWPL